MRLLGFMVIESLPVWIVLLFFVVGVWELVWKGIALWKCGRNNQLVWFVFILVLNTLGILPILYLLFFQENSKKK